MSKMLLMLFAPVIATFVGFIPVIIFHIKYLSSAHASWWRPNHNAYLGLLSLITANTLLIMADPDLRIYSDFIMFILFYALGVMLAIPPNKMLSRRIAGLGLYIIGVTAYISHLYGGRGTVPALTFNQMWLYQNKMGMNVFHFSSVIAIYVLGGIVLFSGIRFAIGRDDILTEALIVAGYSLFGAYMYFGGKSLFVMLIFALIFAFVVYGLSELVVLLIWSFTGRRLED